MKIVSRLEWSPAYATRRKSVLFFVVVERKSGFCLEYVKFHTTLKGLFCLFVCLFVCFNQGHDFPLSLAGLELTL